VTNPGSGGGWSPQPEQGFPQGGYPQQGWTGAPGGPQPAQPGWPTDPNTGQNPAFGPQAAGQQYPQQGQQFAYQVPGPEQPKKRTGLVIGAIVAVIVLVAGGVGAWFLFSGSEPEGEATPTAAATKLFDSMAKSDLVGVFEALPPGEAALLGDTTQSLLDELKRLEILKKDTNLSQIAGVEVKVEGLKFDEAAAEQVNDHLVITKLVEGKITITADGKQVPFTEKFLDLAGVEEKDRTKDTEEIDITKEVQKSGDPIRIATVKVNDQWYPSLFYTIADNVLQEEKESWPKERIEPKGADSPEAALRALLEAALQGDPKRVIELLPPGEMSVLHDLGPILVKSAGLPGMDDEVTLAELKTERRDVRGGVSLVPKTVVLEKDGDQLSIEVDGECAKLSAPDGSSEELCADELAEDLGSASDLPPGMDEMAERMVKNLLETGVVAVEVDGKWYISPGRTVSELLLAVLRSMEPGDLEKMVR